MSSPKNWLCTTVPNSAFSDLMLMTWNQPCWEYLFCEISIYCKSEFLFSLGYPNVWHLPICHWVATTGYCADSKTRHIPVPGCLTVLESQSPVEDQACLVWSPLQFPPLPCAFLVFPLLSFPLCLWKSFIVINNLRTLSNHFQHLFALAKGWISGDSIFVYLSNGTYPVSHVPSP